MSKGFMLVLEGPDGSGKTTQTHLLAEFFRMLGRQVVFTREPGGTPVAEEIRNLVLSPREEKVCYKTELLLFFAARAQHVEALIKPALEAGKVVICDRFVDSTYAYQCFGRGLPYHEIEALETYTLGGFTPDLTLYFDLPTEVGASRAVSRGKLDRLEQENMEFFQRVARGYRRRYEFNRHRYHRIDASRSIVEVFDQIRLGLKEHGLI